MKSTRQKSFSLSKISTRDDRTDCLVSPRGSEKKKLQRVFLFSKILLVSFFILLVQVVLAPSFAHAQNISPTPSTTPLGQGLEIIQKPLGLPSLDIRVIIANIIKVALGLIGTILVLLMIYGGYLYMTSAGNDEQIGTAKKILQNAAIGLAIILSAYAIVAFVLQMLGVGTGPIAPSPIIAPGTQNFAGSGALGNIIKDHYPARNQKEVPRNTKIIITFRRPIRPDSVIDDKNKTALDQNNKTPYGDCINIGDKMNWINDCDSLKLDADHILITRSDTNQPIAGASVLAYYESSQTYGADKVFTLVIRPYDTLGSADSAVPYLVHVGNKILLDDPANNNPAIFANRGIGNSFYEWSFTCSTLLDTTPPYVENTFPADKTTEDKNSVIQIDFSEAMDPTGLQGAFSNAGQYYQLAGNSIFLQSGASSIPLGTFDLTNGYRTLEFTPSSQCAANACGAPIFCLPVCDTIGGKCQTDKDNFPIDTYKMLVRAASTFSASSFEAIPFSGAMDISGNALDANKNIKVDAVDQLLPVFAVQGNPKSQEVPDNFTWSFVLRDHIDLTPPILSQITPGLDAENISANTPWDFLWNKRMRVAPMYDGISVTEKPTPADRGDNIPLCLVPRVSFLPDGTTSTTIDHCPFLDGTRQYYFPAVTSVIEDAHFNCFYPGQGPGGQNELQAKKLHSAVCDSKGNNCCAVDANAPNSQFCCNGMVDKGRQAVKDCNAYLQGISP